MKAKLILFIQALVIAAAIALLFFLYTRFDVPDMGTDSVFPVAEER